MNIRKHQAIRKTMLINNRSEKELLCYCRVLFHAFFTLFALSLFFDVTVLTAQPVTTGERRQDGKTLLSLANVQVECLVVLDSSKLVYDKLSSQPEWAKRYATHPSAIETDADFGMEIMWIDWQAPGKVNNAEHPVNFNKKD